MYLVLLFTLSRCFLVSSSGFLLSVMLCVFCSLCGYFIQCDIQLLVLAAWRQSWQRLGYQLDHQVTFNPWDQTQSRFGGLIKTTHVCYVSHQSTEAILLFEGWPFCYVCVSTFGYFKVFLWFQAKLQILKTDDTYICVPIC